jgi:hypothetical protein
MARGVGRTWRRSTKSRRRPGGWVAVSACLVAALTGSAAVFAGGPHAAIASSNGSESGSAWQVVAPAASPGPGPSFNSVSCPETDFCMAAGYYATSAGVGRAKAVALYEIWNGTSWRIVPSPSTPGYLGGGEISAVSCASTSFCVAVGNYIVYASTGAIVGEKPLTEEWNGGDWTVVPSPTPAQVYAPSAAVDLSGVSCPSSSSCVAVGVYQTDGNSPFQPLIEAWNGGGWTIEQAPSVGSISYLDAVSCVSASVCVAGGAEESSTAGPDHAILLDGREGDWSPAYTVDKVPANASSIDSVSCSSSVRCVATGRYTVHGANYLLDANLNGGSWSVPTTPATLSSGVGVSCTRASLCTTVGVKQIAVWDGLEWTRTTIPEEPAAPSLHSVSCAGTMCMAVGTVSTSNDQPTAEYLPSHDQVEVHLDPLRVGATGLEVVKATITDTGPDGAPVADQAIKIEPPLGYETPALICDAPDRLVYPTLLHDRSALGASFERRTNADGEIDLTIYTGTVEGSWLIEAGEPGAPPSQWGRRELEISASGGRTALPVELPALLVAASDKKLTDFRRGGLDDVLDWLGDLKAHGGERAGVLSGVGFAPVWGRDRAHRIHVGVVLFADATAVRQRVFDYLDGKSDAIPPESEAIVIDVSNMRELQFGTALAGHAVDTVGYRLPSLKEWADGGVIDIGENTRGEERKLPIAARGRARFGFVDPVGAEDLTYQYGPYPPFGSAQALPRFSRCVRG